ncbi:MAG: 3'-5' exonuclease [Methanomassiliicoccaceae archaeon]|jgi:DNA polymerase-3 subunit epsilon|nr:3'-5' exonuclease [Methanomassiliicoccaceae archaeon]
MIKRMSKLDEFCMPEVFVIDTETTGLDGAPKDKVVDIAICRVTLGGDSVDTVYSSIVGHDTSKWNNELRHAWIFENTDLTAEMVRNAPPEADVVRDVSRILSGKNVTSFNYSFDFDKFLYRQPWSLRDIIVPFKCVMIASKDVCRLPGMYEDYKYPRLDQAYSMIVKGDPAGIAGKQAHRALSDAVMASYILLELYRTGHY